MHQFLALHRRSLLRAGVSVLVASTISASALAVVNQASDEGARHPAPARTVVLVHGSFADGSCWNDVIRILQARGIRVVSVQNPLNSLAGDVAAVTRVLNQQSEPVVLVGHSWGGVVITEAGVHPKVQSLVYVAAFAPDVGGSVGSLLQGGAPPPWLGDLKPDEAGYVTLNEYAYLNYFAPDLPLRDRKALQASQTPTFGGTLNDATTFAAWRSKPSWYVLAEDDQFIPANLQHAMSSRIGAKVTRIRSSHVAMISHPHPVADVITEAVRN
jgi:pimeloyl-ACP methyl ester carboxylesterase